MYGLHDNKTSIIWDELSKCLNQPPEIMFDMGPGYINSEAWGCKHKFPDCKIIGVEPNDSRYDSLIESYPGIFLKTAIGKNCDSLTGFHGIAQYPDTDNWSDFRISITEKEQTEYVEREVPCTTIDTLYEEYGPAKHMILWADIEGAELDMLRGAEDTLRSGCIDAIYIEILTPNTLNIPSLNEVKGYLSKFNYDLFKTITSCDYIFRLEN